MIFNVSPLRLLFLALLGAFLGLQSAYAAPAASVVLEDLTWTELQQQIAAGKTTILVPIGGTEQSGPYMALGKHNMRVKALAVRIAEKLGNAIVAPVVAYVPEGSVNPPTAHMRFPGTITQSDEVFEKVLESAARSFKLHGFHDIVFLGDHGGYQADLLTSETRLNREWAATSIRAHALPEYYRTTQNEYVQYLKSRGYGASEIGTHAGLADTSLTLALDAQMVREEQLSHGAKVSAEQGVYGDPRRASAELGQPGVDAIVEKTVEAIRKAVIRPAR
ncbi:MAG TPA: creatininase family protein [Burkholderiaceae bacterium]|jgi:creatinine amidohydrolase/Fe(II)-dependent formamide hydrolase-like protein